MKSRLRGAPSLNLDSSVIQDNVPVETIRGIWIGSIHTAFNKDFLSDVGMTHVINLSQFPNTFPSLFCYLTLTLRDKDQSNLLCCIPASNIFIESGLQGLDKSPDNKGGVLVHCSGGRSRSAAIVVAYMMSSYGKEYEECFGFLRSRRPVVKINRGFERQLRAYRRANCDVYAAHQVILQENLLALAKAWRPAPDAQGPQEGRRAGKTGGGRGGGVDGGGGGAEDEEGDDGGGASLRKKKKDKAGADQKPPPPPCRIRLLRPRSPSVQVIPPLRAMGMEICCRGFDAAAASSSAPLLRPCTREKQRWLERMSKIEATAASANGGGGGGDGGGEGGGSSSYHSSSSSSSGNGSSSGKVADVGSARDWGWGEDAGRIGGVGGSGGDGGDGGTDAGLLRKYTSVRAAQADEQAAAALSCEFCFVEPQGGSREVERLVGWDEVMSSVV
eukprot:g600.t1